MSWVLVCQNTSQYFKILLTGPFKYHFENICDGRKDGRNEGRDLIGRSK